MASSILLRSIGGTDDKRIVLSNSQFARVMDIGTNWTQVRVGIRFCIRDTGANLTSTPRFFVGLSSGTSNLFGDASTTHCLGVWPAGAPTWTRAAGPPVSYTTGINSGQVVKRVGTTNTVAGTGVIFNTIGVVAEPSSGGRGVWFVDITKGSPNFTVGGFFRVGVTSFDVSLEQFLTNMELPVPSLTDHGVGGNVAIAVDEAVDGFFNAIHVHWDRSTPEIEISDIAYARLA